MEQSRSGIGVSKSVQPTLKALTEKYFESMDAAFMACVTLAIAKELPIEATGPVERTWHAGGRRQELLDFIAWHLSAADPVQMMEQLGHAGLLYAKDHLEKNSPFEAIFAP